MVRRKKTTRRRKVTLSRRKNPVRKNVRRLRSNPRRKSGRRGMSWDTASQYRPSRKRKSLRKRARSSASVSKHRPTLYKTRSGWRRPKRSRYSIPGVRRMNPAFRMLSQKNLTRVAGLTGGTILGFMVLPVFYQAVPAQMKNRKWIGLGNVAVGALMFGYMKNKVAKNAGVMIAATGIYDMVTQNFSQLGLPTIPETNWLTAQFNMGPSSAAAVPSTEEQQGLTYEAGGRKLLGLSYSGRATVPSSLGLSYEAAGLGSSWEADSDNPYNGIFN